MTDTAAPAELRLGNHVVPGGVRDKPLGLPRRPGRHDAACNGNGTADAGGRRIHLRRPPEHGQPARRGPHNGGEVWAETLWDLRTAVGRDAALALIAGGMRLTPDNPSMLDARDAILRQALAMRSAPGAPDDYFGDGLERLPGARHGLRRQHGERGLDDADRELRGAPQRALRPSR